MSLRRVDTPQASAPGAQYGIGGTMLNMTGGSVITEGDEASAIYLFGRNSRDGDLISNVANASLTTNGYQSSVLFSQHGLDSNDRTGDINTGDIKIDARNVIIASEGTGLDDGATLSHGIYGNHNGVGDIDIDARGGSITTAGAASYGIAGYQSDYGDILIDTHDGHTITTTGTIGHGIVAYQFDTTDPDRRIEINMGGGSINVSGLGAQGVRVGAVTGGTARFASLDPDGYRRQTVTVNGQVTSTTEGVFLANGGRVIIGPQGVINSGSGIAILATGDIPADSTDLNNVIPAIKPKLRVDLNLGGRKVEQALGNNWIINDGGETTIAVNSTVLHEGATGFTGLTAPNGAWEVTMREHGVKVTDRTATDPNDWVSTLSTSSAKIIADRDFSAADFTETAVCPPGQIGTPPDCAPPMCPPGQIGTPPDNCMEPPPPMCPPGQIGTPPGCKEPPAPMCPPGQIGTPPGCKEPPAPMCPSGQIGAPLTVWSHQHPCARRDKSEPHRTVPSLSLKLRRPCSWRNMRLEPPCMRYYPISCCACKNGNQPGSVFPYPNRRYTSGSWGARDRKSLNARL